MAAIPEESKIYSAAEKRAMIKDGIKQGRREIKHAEFKQAMKKASSEYAEHVGKKAATAAAEKTAKEATEKLMKMGKVGTAVGIGAAVISGLNKNKGRQNNSQLYGQKGY